MIKRSVQQEDITIINIYAPNTVEPAYVKQILTELKEEIECNALILGDLNMPLTPMDRSTGQKISKDTEALNNTLEQWTRQTSTELSTQKQQDTHSSQVHMEDFQDYIIYKTTKRASGNSKGLKLYKPASQTTRV